MDDFIVLSRSGGIGTITLNHAIDGVFWSHSIATQLVLALNAIEFDDTLHATVITVAGPPSRSKRILRDHRADSQKAAIQDEWDRLYETMCRLKKPLVAAINSIAAGSAFEVALLCDIRIAHASAMMGRPGTVSGLGGLKRAVGGQDFVAEMAAKGHILNRNLISAQTCLELGLINEIVPVDDLLTEASILAQNLRAVAATARKLPKRRLRELSSAGFRARIELSKRVYSDAYASASPGRAMKSFLETRMSQN